MCGIAGRVGASVREADGVRFTDVLGRLAHRGPDDLGWLLLDPRGRITRGRDDLGEVGPVRAALLHRRLAILDLEDTGWQPASTPDDRCHLVFNGEIYNYLELRPELEDLGHRFVSTGDTEVLLAALTEWGRAALPRLVGMFAFAFLDLRRNRLLLARDFFGIKPLYYALDEEELSFASEIPALLALTGRPRTANPASLYRYLRYGLADHGGETLFEGVRQLPAASLLDVDLDEPDAAEPDRYWRLMPDSDLGLSFDEAALHLRDLFLDSVRLHLRSDVPVGSALSGGVDSSAIVMAMRELEGPGLELHAFSYIADDDSVSEERWADLVAGAAGARIHKVRPSASELAADLRCLIAAHGEPFQSTSIYAQYRVFRLARDAGIKVMLDGQGADELLGGYDYYLAVRTAELVRRGRLGEAARFFRRACDRLAGGRRWLLPRVGQFLLPPALQGAARRLVGEEPMPDWLDEGWFTERGVRPTVPSGSVLSLRERLIRDLTETGLAPLLRYEDRNSMAHSIESRVPFLTPALASFVLSLPEEYLIAPDGTSKAVFRRAMRGLVPDPVLDRRDKIGFATPEERWMPALDSWVQEVLESDAAHRIPVLVNRRVVEQWKEVKEGRRRFDHRVWRWVNLIEWSRLLDVAYV